MSPNFGSGVVLDIKVKFEWLVCSVQAGPRVTSSMRILGGPCNVGSEPGPHKTGKVGMCVCVCVCLYKNNNCKFLEYTMKHMW